MPRSSNAFSRLTASDECAWQHEPAESQPRCEQLARAAGVDDALGREPLQRADGLAVVAVLGVVVVLDHDRVVLLCPCQQCGASLGRQHAAEWRLVRGRHEQRVGGDVGERVGAQAVCVDGDRNWLESAVCDDTAMDEEARVLDGDPSRAAGVQRAADERDPLCQAARDKRPLSAGGDTAGAPEVARERDPQLRCADRICVPERRVGHVPHDGAQRAQPCRAREACEVRHAGVEVLRQRAREPGGRWHLRGPGRCGDERPGAAPRRQVALGRQLRVGLDDDAAGDAQLAGELARGRQARAGRKPPRARGIAQLALELGVQRLGSLLARQRQQQLHRPWSGSERHDWICRGVHIVPTVQRTDHDRRPR